MRYKNVLWQIKKKNNLISFIFITYLFMIKKLFYDKTLLFKQNNIKENNKYKL